MENKEPHIVHLGGNIFKTVGLKISIEDASADPQNTDFFIEGKPREGARIYQIQGGVKQKLAIVLVKIESVTKEDPISWTIMPTPIRPADSQFENSAQA